MSFALHIAPDEMEELLRYADHLVFNSPRQLLKFGPMAKAAGKSVGLRINPEHSTQEGHAIYDPCSPGSRLGTTRAQWEQAVTEHPELPDLLDGLHFHTLCEQDAEPLRETLDAVAEKFGDLLPKMKWLNFGGGHHVTRPGYDLQLLESCICRARDEWGVQVYLEPGEAWALNAGYLVTRVLDVIRNGDTQIAVLDMSARLPYAGRDRNAVPSAAVWRRRSRRIALYLPFGWANLPCGRCGGRLQLCHAAARRRSLGFRRYGHLYHLQKQYVQRHAAAGDLYPPGG